MLNYIKVSLSDPGIRKIVSACYPNYKGRKVKLHGATSYSMSNYWDGGTRDYVVAYHLESGMVKAPSQTTTSPFREQAHATVEIPEGIAMVEHTIFQGKDVGITIHLNPANMAKLLPAEAKPFVRSLEKISVPSRQFPGTWIVATVEDPPRPQGGFVAYSDEDRNIKLKLSDEGVTWQRSR